MLTETAIRDALRHVQEPELHRDIVSLDMVKDVAHRWLIAWPSRST